MYTWRRSFSAFTDDEDRVRASDCDTADTSGPDHSGALVFNLIELIEPYERIELTHSYADSVESNDVESNGVKYNDVYLKRNKSCEVLRAGEFTQHCALHLEQSDRTRVFACDRFVSEHHGGFGAPPQAFEACQRCN